MQIFCNRQLLHGLVGRCGVHELHPIFKFAYMPRSMIPITLILTCSCSQYHSYYVLLLYEHSNHHLSSAFCPYLTEPID